MAEDLRMGGRLLGHGEIFRIEEHMLQKDPELITLR